MRFAARLPLYFLGIDETAFRELLVERGSSARGFGLTVGGIFASWGLLRWYFAGSLGLVPGTMIFAGSVLFIVGAIMPRSLQGLNEAWTLLGIILQHLTSPVIMGIIFFLVLTPMAVVYRALGSRFLELGWDKLARSYWVKRETLSPWGKQMQRQF